MLKFFVSDCVKSMLNAQFRNEKLKFTTKYLLNLDLNTELNLQISTHNADYMILPQLNNFLGNYIAKNIIPDQLKNAINVLFLFDETDVLIQNHFNNNNAEDPVGYNLPKITDIAVDKLVHVAVEHDPCYYSILRKEISSIKAVAGQLFAIPMRNLSSKPELFVVEHMAMLTHIGNKREDIVAVYQSEPVLALDTHQFSNYYPNFYDKFFSIVAILDAGDIGEIAAQIIVLEILKGYFANQIGTIDFEVDVTSFLGGAGIELEDADLPFKKGKVYRLWIDIIIPVFCSSNNTFYFLALQIKNRQTEIKREFKEFDKKLVLFCNDNSMPYQPVGIWMELGIIKSSIEIITASEDYKPARQTRKSAKRKRTSSSNEPPIIKICSLESFKISE
ncbi:uncharacterized protein ASCRUDRAFT_88530 [Ascoidea rubescens DSM 1968]|uniref:Uncharacterized protein n=1 Tax=Ascoidea rubescens DSM 1968 TaxID=1344418 RepID=A0A1D2V971_9ASCO|nr:hypothetical protein ASCRUDRAFT_88530 [Ascoidea rubescens DSM 1968]ODV58194.1 hypothetical protein ASCRUDRAFT_88530 [Ascoidea rubescens DSM 1968]